MSVIYRYFSSLNWDFFLTSSPVSFFEMLNRWYSWQLSQIKTSFKEFCSLGMGAVHVSGIQIVNIVLT